MAEVMTDKALVEIPAPYRGRVTRLYYKEGDIAKVHAPLFELVDESESGGQAPAASSPEPAEAKPAREAEKAEPPSARNRKITPPKTLSCRISAKVSLSARWWNGALPKVTKSRKTSLLWML